VGVWLPRVLFESALIVASILFALALDEWQEDREIDELVHRSMASFERELQRNQERIEAVQPYHEGLQHMLESRIAGDAIESAAEFRNILDALQPAVLLNSAWQTAVATGVLSRMDYEVVAAVSLTYSTQNRFDEVYRAGNNALLAPVNFAEDRLGVSVYNAARFIADVTIAESELIAFYQQTLELINAYEAENGIELQDQ
jgi:hypothetical protein